VNTQSSAGSWRRLLLSSRRDFIKAALTIAATSGLRHAFGAETPSYPFIEVPSSKSAITWVHTSGMSAERYLPETMGAGCAFLDYDNDGWMDIYLVNSGKCDFYDPAQPLSNALYRNNRDGTFTDVTQKAGVAGAGYGQGVAVGDYDGDGFPDLYVTGYGRSLLYHNNGNGTFTDVTEKAGLSAPGWATSAVWFDYDNDGKLDLFVCRYVDFDKVKHHRCMAPKVAGAPDQAAYCNPRSYGPSESWLFHNKGDGTFADVSQSSGIAEHRGKALGAVATDINNDGRLDLFVANDTVADFLFLNQGNGRFEDIAEQAGVAYSAEGRPRGGMGVDSADYNQDGWMDLFVTNLDREMFSMYKNHRDETFDDDAARNGVGAATKLMSGWGLKFFDYDNDGDLDLFLVNGEPDDQVGRVDPRISYREPLMLFENTGKEFKNISSEAGPVFARQMAARGLALGDFDNDGAVDVLISNNNEAPLLLRNNAGTQNHWLGVKLVGKKANIDAIGARLIYQSGDLKRTRMKVGGGSYLSSHDPRIVLGIGKRTKIDWLEITWPQPSGLKQRFTDLPIDRYITIREGNLKWE
jgi:enediyne biosynthesis protein E4